MNAREAALEDVVRELCDIIEGVRAGETEIDSLTLQPARAALAMPRETGEPAGNLVGAVNNAIGFLHSLATHGQAIPMPHAPCSVGHYAEYHRNVLREVLSRGFSDD